MTAVDSDIDSFIRQQKAKLANERQILNNTQRMDSGYQEIWRQQHGRPVEPHRSPRAAKKYYRPSTEERAEEEDTYRKTWYETKGKHLQPGANSRKQWAEPVKLSPRGYLDTTAIIQQAQAEKDEDEYKERWKEEHLGQEPTPRRDFREASPPIKGLNIGPSAPTPHSPRTHNRLEREEYQQTWEYLHPEGPNYRPVQPTMATRGGYLDTGSIIREVQREREAEEQQMRMRGGQARPPQPNRGGGRPDSSSEYKKFWHQQQEQRPASDPFGIPKDVDESEDFGLFHNLGAEDKRRKMHKEPANQLNLHGINKNTIHCRRAPHGQSNLREQTDDHKASTLLTNQSDAAKLERMKERNREYREFLQNRTEKDQRRYDSKKPTSMQYAQQGNDGVFNTLPGLRYSTSAQKKDKSDERNREYNDLMKQKRQRGGAPPGEPRQGWNTPTYEEILGRQRREDAQFRRANDPNYQGDYNARETELRIKGLDRDLAAKRSDQPQFQNGILEDPYWLSPRRSNTGQYVNNPLSHGSPVGFASSKRPPHQQDGQYFNSLPIGGAGASEQSQKQNYAMELRQQMEEARLARKMEKHNGSLVNNNAVAMQNNTAGVLPGQGAVVVQGGRTPRNTKVQRYHTDVIEQLKELDSRSPRGNSLNFNRQNTEDRRGGGLGLNLGPSTTNPNRGGYHQSDPGLGIDMSILERPTMSTIDPPAGLQYQPSTFITANAIPTMNNSIDEAYNFYGSLNPFDPNQPQAPPPGGGRGDRRGGGDRGGDIPSLNLGGLRDEPPGASRVRFKDNRGGRTPAIGMDFATDNERKEEKQFDVGAYREELERQIQERNRKKQREKEDQERYDRKIEEEARTYDPFGKGGGGAPMRDPEGNVISDLRQMRSDNNDPNSYRSRSRQQQQYDFSPRGYGAPDPIPVGGNTSRAANSYRDDLIGPPPTQTTGEGDPTFARGGHGIFGMPKTDAEKKQSDKYKYDLRRQIEAKKAEEMRKKELERLEEEREQKILDAQRARIQQEFEEEQRKAKAKEEEARLKNEEMIRLAEEKKREIERQRKEADDRRQQDLREEREREIRERQILASPPVPAARTRTAERDPPPISSRREHIPRAQSADVLNQLADMRSQLRKERQRVQHMLEDQEDDVEIYDPRQIHRPPPAPVVRPEIDVFETAMNRNAVAVRRTPGDRASAQAVEDFNALKHKGDSDSRKMFRQLYPSEPESSDALESQQMALLRQQEERLHNMKDRHVNGVGSFPDDFEDLPKRNSSARMRRRARAPSSPRFDRLTTPDYNHSRATFGSQASINVDRLTRKNEDRLRRLRDMQGDDLSLYDPDDVLDRFMTKQGHNRRTFDDDYDIRSDSFSPAFRTPFT